MEGKQDMSDSEGPLIDDNIIRIQLRKPGQRKWELRTRNHSPSVKFPIIQLFDSDGNLLVETNDENISIKSSDFEEHPLQTTHSLQEKDFRHYINKNGIRKNNTITGFKIYTRVYKTPPVTDDNAKNCNKSYVIRDDSSVVNIPSKLTLNNNSTNLHTNSLETSPFQSEGISDISSYKSSDNETCDLEKVTQQNELNKTLSPIENDAIANKGSNYSSISSLSDANPSSNDDKKNDVCEIGLHKSRSFNDSALRDASNETGGVTLSRSKSGAAYNPPHNKISFLNTYLKSLPARMNSYPDWFTLQRRRTIESPQNSRVPVRRCELPKISLEKIQCPCKMDDNTSDNEFINIPTDYAADFEMKKRLKMFRRGLSEIEPGYRDRTVFTEDRRHSVSGMVRAAHTSSSESVDEADVVLSRLKRRILKNKIREKRRSLGEKFQLGKYRFTRST
ncbi:unnamed protein product [Diatraea saccharalis]|uniref:Uncharacterized protein n=1 Tax=Diatraea saccharalis TaxID=40085 RepID=A0A9N9QY88_9NEOP|nr:unnamed protein product [Diatraea saccharalis]